MVAIADPFTEQDLAAAVEQAGELTDEFILAQLNSVEQIPNLHEGAVYSLGLDVADRKARGKRVRPALCILTAKALGAPPLDALPFAAAIEILHNFALVHDDIEDGDTMRRGRPSTWVRYGLAHGINIGDYLFARMFQVVLRDERNPIHVREQLLLLLEKTLEELFGGQALDISARASRHFTVADYEALVARKTGSYLAAPLLGGALIAGANPATLAALERLGQDLGPLFQVRDDLIDLTTGKGRAEIGNDIREGKRSYLVALAAEAATPADRQQLFDILDRTRELTSADDVAWCIDLFARTGSLARAEERCVSLRESALATIDELDQPLQRVLRTAVEVMAKRAN